MKGLKGQLEDLTSAMESTKNNSESSNQNDDEQTKVHFAKEIMDCYVQVLVKYLRPWPDCSKPDLASPRLVGV